MKRVAVRITALWALLAFVFGLLALAPAQAALADTIATAGGTGTSGDTGDGGQARDAAINLPRSIFWVNGGYVFAEPWSNRVRMVGVDGIVSTIAGTGAAGYSGDGGPATAAQLNFVHSAAPMADGSYVLADTLNNRIRKISPNGVITTVAGDGNASYSGDGGPAIAASINSPRGVVGLADGGFLIPDSSNNLVRRVSPTGIITTVAGTGTAGFSGDGGPATSAELWLPFGVAPTPDGGFLIVDAANQRIRKVSASGGITTAAGSGVMGYGGDGGPATAAALNNPHNLAVRADGGFLIADASNERVRSVAADGTITTLTGTGVRGYTGDGGPPAGAQISVPKAVGVSPSGDVLIAEEQNNVIRFVGAPKPPVATSTPPSISRPARTGGVLQAFPGGWTGTGPTFTYQWRRCSSSGTSCVDLAGATAKTYTVVSADAGATIRVAVTATNVAGSAVAVSAQTAVVTSTTTAPVNIAPPTISGSPQVGQTLTTTDGTWSGTPPLSFAYQWRRCNSSGAACTDIAGATSRTYVLTSADAGLTLRAVVTASNSSTQTAYVSTVVSDGASSYWRFDDASGPLTDMQGGQNGTYLGSPQRNAAGLLVNDPDTAVALNGTSQYLDVPANPAWTPQSFSIEILVRPSALPVNKTIWATQGALTGGG